MALAAWSGACHVDAPRATAPDADATLAGTPDEASDPPSRPLSRPGVGHTSPIDRIAVSPTGKSVVTRDQQGGLRLWPDLQGGEEPLLVPGRAVDGISVAERDDGWTVATVDASGGVEILGVDREGHARKLASLPPFSPVAEALVLSGGNHTAVLFRDHSIALVGPGGEVLAKFEERKFRPRTLRASADGRGLVAIVPSGRTNVGFTFELQRLAIEGEDGGELRIIRDGSPVLVTSPVDVTPTTLALSPDLRRVGVLAWTDRGGVWGVVVHPLTPDAGEQRTFDLQMRGSVTPAIGFVTPDNLVMTSNELATGALVDLKRNTVHGRTAPASDFTHQGRVQAYGGGVQVAGYGTALFVHEALRRKHRFLSYRTLQASSAALSPSGQWVAWATFQGRVYVEAVGDGDPGAPTPAPVELANATEGFGMSWVRFVDDEHLVVVESNGAIVLHHWPSDTPLARSGVSGTVREIAYDRERKLLFVGLHVNDMRMVEISEEGIGEAWMLVDQAYRGGLFRGPRRDPKHQPVVWTLDGSSRLRSYTLAELRSDLSRQDVADKGETLATGQVPPMAIDGRGRHYGVRWDASKMMLFVDPKGDALRTRPALADNVSRMVLAPDGASFLVVYDAATPFAALHDAETLEDRWSFSTGMSPSDVAWSDDGKRIAFAGVNGAVVVDASTGKVLRRRCGLAFGVSGGPPQSALQTLGQRSMCEL